MMSPYPEDRSDRQSPSRDLPPGASCEKKIFLPLMFSHKGLLRHPIHPLHDCQVRVAHCAPGEAVPDGRTGAVEQLVAPGGTSFRQIFFFLCESKRRALFCLSIAWLFRF